MTSPFNPDDTPVSPFNPSDEVAPNRSPYNPEDVPTSSAPPAAPPEQPNLLHTFLKGAAAPFEPIADTAIEAGKQVDEAVPKFISALDTVPTGIEQEPQHLADVTNTGFQAVGSVANVANSPFTTVVGEEGKALASQAGVQNPQLDQEEKQKAAEYGNLATLPFALPDAAALAKNVGGYLSHVDLSPLITDAFKTPEAVKDLHELPMQDYVDKYMPKPTPVDVTDHGFGAYADKPNPSIENTSTAAKELAPQTGVSDGTATQLANSPATASIQTNAPNVVAQSIKAPITPPPIDPNLPKLSVENIQAGEGAIKGWWNNNVNQNTIISSYARSYAKENGIDFGAGDILEKSPIPTIQHLSERGSMTGLSYIGDGEATSVQRIKAGTNSTWEDTATKPITTILKQAQDGGASIADLEEHMKARTALNDYANIGRIITERNVDKANNTAQIVALRTQRAATTGFNDKYTIQTKIDDFVAQNKAIQKGINDLGKKQSIMPQGQAQAIITKHANSATMQQFAGDMNKLHDSLLQDSVTAGRISQDAADRMRKFHPDYVPLWRDVDDYGFDIARSGYHSTMPTGYVGRDISSTGASQINVLDNITHNIMNSTRKNDNFMLKNQIFNFLHNSQPDAWDMMFREPLADVDKAINILNTTDKPNMSAVEITPPSKTRVENYDKVKFPIGNGKTIELSAKNKNMFEAVAQPLKAGQPVGPIWRAVQFPSKFVSAAFTKYNPAFAPFNALKAVMDSAVSKVGMTLGKDFVPGVSQTMELARGILDKDFYDKFTFEYGFGNKLNKMYGGLSDEQISKYIQKGNIPDGILRKIDGGFAEYNNRFDIATRSLQYRVLRDKLIKQGLPPDKAAAGALSAAKDIHLNFQNTGANTTFNHVLQTIPFSRVFLTSVDKVLREGLYAPGRIATGLLGMFAAYHGIQKWNDSFKNTNGQPIGTNGIDPDTLKEFTIVRTGSGPNDYIKLPLGWMLTKQLPNMETAWNMASNKIGQLMHGAAETRGNQAVEQESFLKGRITGKELSLDVLDSLFGYVTPKNMLPAAVQPFFGALTNKDSFGHSIVPDSTLQEPAFMQHSSFTDSAAVDLTNKLAEKGIDISPAKALYYIHEFTGNIGTTAAIAAAHVWDASQNRSPAQPETKDIPIVGRYLGGSNVPNDGVEKEYNKIYRNLLPVVKTEQALAKQADNYPSYGPMLQQFREDHAEELTLAKRFEDVNKTVNGLQKDYARIVSGDSTSMPGILSGKGFLGDSGKRTAIDANRIQQLDQMRAAVEWLHQQANEGNFSADQLYSDKETRSPISEFINNITSGKPQKPLDNASKIKYNIKSTPDNNTLKDFLNAVGQ